MVLVSDSNDETNFSHKLLLTNTLVSKLHESFVNGSSDSITFWKTQLSKMIQSGGFLADLLASIPKVMFQTGVEAERIKKRCTLAKNAVPDLVEKATEYYINKGINELNNKKFVSSKGSGVALTNNKTKGPWEIKEFSWKEPLKN